MFLLIPLLLNKIMMKRYLTLFFSPISSPLLATKLNLNGISGICDDDPSRTQTKKEKVTD
eukprot:TRINITY_DN7544_c0_g1_i1.p1 TRINITY_DN7544_c0_g1~~TRINITY_DN7544_c0_g1_i1.p1  ORF type:complete len:60 (-),score=5.55 TRINITY_DN7544_c0_g1_i1:5-184(-)